MDSDGPPRSGQTQEEQAGLQPGAPLPRRESSPDDGAEEAAFELRRISGMADKAFGEYSESTIQIKRPLDQLLEGDLIDPKARMFQAAGEMQEQFRVIQRKEQEINDQINAVTKTAEQEGIDVTTVPKIREIEEQLDEFQRRMAMFAEDAANFSSHIKRWADNYRELNLQADEIPREVNRFMSGVEEHTRDISAVFRAWSDVVPQIGSVLETRKQTEQTGQPEQQPDDRRAQIEKRLQSFPPGTGQENAAAEQQAQLEAEYLRKIADIEQDLGIPVSMETRQEIYERTVFEPLERSAAIQREHDELLKEQEALPPIQQ